MSIAGPLSTAWHARRPVTDVSRATRTERSVREGRGRPSTLDMLPEEADGDLAWLNDELRIGKRLQIDLLAEFNARLADHGIAPVSKSTFSRYSVRKAMQFRQLDETRRISVELAEMLGVDSADKMTIAVSEMLKMAAFKLAEGGDLSSKDVMELARANKDAVSAQKMSTDYRRMLERETAEKVAAAVKDVEEIAVAAGVSPETMAKINQRLAGIF
jgi:sugar phosphate isomerase/epimerase